MCWRWSVSKLSAAVLAVLIMILGCSCAIPVQREGVIRDVRPATTALWGDEPGVVRLTEIPALALEGMYDRMGGGEWAACLRAGRRAETYTVISDGVPRFLVRQTWVVVEAVLPQLIGSSTYGIEDVRGCEDFPGMVHSHPKVEGVDGCNRSSTDRRTFWSRGFEFMIVWCDSRYYRWYTKNGETGEGRF